MTVANYLLYTFLIVAILPGPACKKEPPPWQPADSLGKLNKWVYDSMQLYYYWSADMPANPDYSLPTQEFFKQLLSPKDRFSWISNRGTIPLPRATFEQLGFFYTLAPHPFDAQKLIGIITCVVPVSNAGTRGLKRGMLFTAVNNYVLTPANRQTAEQDLQAETAMLQLAAFNSDRTAIIDSVRVGMQHNYTSLKSIYATNLFELNGKKTGYLAYFLCAENNDANLLQSMQKLKREGVSECIIDLRYNAGGSVASATKLAAMLVPSFNPNSTFIIYRGNRNGGTVKETFQDAISYSGNTSGKNMSELQSRNLGLSRVFILTTAATASAAELITHNLAPFMTVIRIGETTLGKDEASFQVEDKRSPRQVEWLINPIVYKIADGLGNGDYATGLVPVHQVIETSRLPLPPLGQPGDLPVDKALTLIYGTTVVNVTAL